MLFSRWSSGYLQHGGDAQTCCRRGAAAANGCPLRDAVLRVGSSSASTALTGRARCVPVARTLVSVAVGTPSILSCAADAVCLPCAADSPMGTGESVAIPDKQRTRQGQSQVISQGLGASILAGSRLQRSPTSESRPRHGCGPFALRKSGLGQPCRVCWQPPPRFRPARRALGRQRASIDSTRTICPVRADLGTTRTAACQLLAPSRPACLFY